MFFESYLVGIPLFGNRTSMYPYVIRVLLDVPRIVVIQLYGTKRCAADPRTSLFPRVGVLEYFGFLDTLLSGEIFVRMRRGGMENGRGAGR